MGILVISFWQVNKLFSAISFRRLDLPQIIWLCCAATKTKPNQWLWGQKGNKQTRQLKTPLGELFKAALTADGRFKGKEWQLQGVAVTER